MAVMRSRCHDRVGGERDSDAADAHTLPNEPFKPGFRRRMPISDKRLSGVPSIWAFKEAWESAAESALGLIGETYFLPNFEQGRIPPFFFHCSFPEGGRAGSATDV